MHILQQRKKRKIAGNIVLFAIFALSYIITEKIDRVSAVCAFSFAYETANP